MIRIIIADDHAMFRQGLFTLLSGADDIQIVAQCANGIEALAATREHLPDVAVLDITMAAMDGLSATRQIIKEKLPTHVVILTMHDDPKMLQQAAQAGAQAFVLKDNAFEQLLETVRTVAGSNELTSFSMPVAGKRQQTLTERELQVLRLIACGLSNRAVAEQLCISIKTVDSHRTNLMRKLDLHSTVELVRHAIATGLA